MDMKIEIICKETIKPSSPTPNHLRTHNFTFLDQIAIGTTNFHVPLILFYTTTSQASTISNHLKKSLQETLVHFYPFAGRRKDDSCNDAGVTYIETHVSGNYLEEVLKDPKFEKLRQLLPMNPNENWGQFKVPELLLIQVNYFEGGGIAIGVCISHVIADASTVGTFVKSWASFAGGERCQLNGVITDCTSIFPPVDPQTFSFSSLNDSMSVDVLLKDVVNKIFVFDGPKIAALRRKIGNTMPCSDLPTRFEALSALILGVVMSITEKKGKDHFSFIAVDLRKRMNPPLPQQCIGNIWRSIPLMSLSNENGIDYNEIARKIREPVRGMNHENVKRILEAGSTLNYLKNAVAALRESEAFEECRAVSFSSWCRFPFYEADFGWGKPTWVTTAIGHNKVAIFMDSRDGEGIEVWLGLHPEIMCPSLRKILMLLSMPPSLQATKSSYHFYYSPQVSCSFLVIKAKECCCDFVA